MSTPRASSARRGPPVWLVVAFAFAIAFWVLAEKSRSGAPALPSVAAQHPEAVREAASAGETAESDATSPAAEPAHAIAPARTQASGSTSARRTLADVLEEVGDLSVPGARERAVEQMRVIERERREAVLAEAARRGLRVRIERPGGVVQELVDFEDGRPVYLTTTNANAAISTGADVLRTTTYGLSGSGITIGLWDGGAARATHQEFTAGARVAVKDGAGAINHATHVAGTLAATGVSATAKGMAPLARVDSYDWTSDKTEMLARAATAPGQSTSLYLSNHSYSVVTGWNYTANTGTPARSWEWYGDGTTTTGYDFDFGRYHANSRDSDSLAFSAPYYLMFRSAGNDRNDNPTYGSTVGLSIGATTVVSYDSSLHPPGDGLYRGGFETIAYDGVAKNVITIGAVGDAVSAGVRSVAAATMTTFSSWGPTDDGRIKPDVVANGDQLNSPINTNDTSYDNYSGTSMASPNATGTAALLIEQYGKLFPGGAMRSATLKALLIHTADDRGNAGPDYKYGWGLINGVAAADLLIDHAANPLRKRLTEGTATTSATTATYDFVWDGASPIRATLVWTDPAGTATTTNDLRTARLVNNLNLKVTGPDGTDFLPFVMPFVGTWTQASMDLPATTGVNNTDNVEQVLIAAPPASGVYRITVSYAGTLTNSSQAFSLLLSGSANQAPPPTLSAVAPASVVAGPATLTLTGINFLPGATVSVQRSGQPGIAAQTTTFTSATSLSASIDLSSAASGAWDVRVTNADGASSTLASSLLVLKDVASENFDGTVSGWSSQSITGSIAWATSTASSQTAPTSMFIAGPASKTTTALVSPSVWIPAGSTNLQLSFWHRYTLESPRDGGRLELSVDGGAWFDVAAVGSGASFVSGGYNTTISATGSASSLSDFAGLQAWSGNLAAFSKVVVSLTSSAKFAGHTLRARWVLATNATTASTGWFVDSVQLIGVVPPANQAPTLASAPDSASTETVADGADTFEVARGSQLGLTVLGDDDDGEPALTYTWSSVQAGPAPTLSANGTNAAKSTTASFSATGDYVFNVTVTDGGGLSVAGSVKVRVLGTATTISVSPPSTTVVYGGTTAFSANAFDQFGAPLSPQPATFAWQASGGGTIGADGVFAANAAGGPYTVTATSGAASGGASVVVTQAPATVQLDGLQRTYDTLPKPVAVTTQPAGLAVSVTYDGATTAPSAVGSYAVAAAIADPNYTGSASGTLVIEPRQFTLGVLASPAAGGVVTGMGVFMEGTVQAITATANHGWLFSGWTGTGIDAPSSPTTTVLVDAEKVVTAEFTAIPPYDLWSSDSGLTGEMAAPDADPDGDGVSNLLEFALGASPLTQTRLPVAVVEPDLSAQPRLTLRLQRPVGLAGVTLRVFASSNLSTWEELTTLETVPGPSEGLETVTARDTQVAGGGARFLRLQATAAP